MTIFVFWVAAPLTIAMAVGTIVARKVVHSAICLCGAMVTLGLLYTTLEAPFLFVAQILVYTGSIMMLFLFTMMLIGIDRRESLTEIIRGQRVVSGIAIGALLALLVFTVAGAVSGGFGNLDEVNERHGGNAQGLAVLLFTKYAFIFEALAALVFTAALAAMVLAHSDQVRAQRSQRGLAAEKLQQYAATGANPAAAPGSGVYARTNSIAHPALLPDGSVADNSVSAVLSERGVVPSDVELLPILVAETAAEINGTLPIAGGA
ncbi:MAG: NADH-quinone oxidoreductase subunit J [Propionibacteriaceae bacterium]|jgi:NADH-quinone oxidoreductase subunit J|nr:NADH-quinone oxidoreductase subunit J [Propionibacteriaceae bacterium]